MNDRPSQIFHQRWLLNAGPAQTTCADQLSAQSMTTNPPGQAGTARRQGWENRVCSIMKNAKRHTETAVAKTRAALSP